MVFKTKIGLEKSANFPKPNTETTISIIADKRLQFNTWFKE